MLILSKKIITRDMVWPLLAVVLTTGCVQLHQFPMNESYQQVTKTQILDPQAAVRNEGIVLPIEGNYGYAVTKAYRKSNSSPQEARGKLTAVELGK